MNSHSRVKTNANDQKNINAFPKYSRKVSCAPEQDTI